MPLLWKKAKVTRITRMVADLQSPKRGSSLVVETGFPTSLIDLFVKNRDRLKRSSLKKKTKSKKKNKNDTNDAENDNANATRLDSVPAEISSSAVVAAEANSDRRSDEPIEAKKNLKKNTAKKECRRPYLFVAVLRVFFVTVVALITKRLALGVTFSAFALFFLDFAAKRVVLRRSRGDESESAEDEDSVAVRSQNLEIASEADVVFVPDLAELSRDKKWGVLDANQRGEEFAPKSEKSKRAKLKRKIIKNFVPKKLRSVSKKRKNAKIGEEFVDVGEEAEESIELSVEEEEDDDETEKEEEVEEEEKEGRKKYCVFVVSIGVVLLGLCWGRIFAFLLTVFWCFGMKLVGVVTTIWRFCRASSQLRNFF